MSSNLIAGSIQPAVRVKKVMILYIEANENV